TRAMASSLYSGVYFFRVCLVIGHLNVLRYYPLNLVSGLIRPLQSRRLIKGSLAFVSVYLTCRITFDFSSTLTTKTLYQCRLKWFAFTDCKANAVGLPPSLVKLRKLFCRYATILFALGTP